MELTQIPQEQLIAGRWYVGRGRTSNVALWTGQLFFTIGDEGGEDVVKGQEFYAADAGCFQPFRLIDEGENVEPIGPGPGWDRHYSRKLLFQ